ncbi:MAG: hypothetical protein BJ554DRAFT_5742, partial [Olpidium bornovanus]
AGSGNRPEFPAGVPETTSVLGALADSAWRHLDAPIPTAAYWDTRKGAYPVDTSIIAKSHRDPVYSISWIQSKTGESRRGAREANTIGNARVTPAGGLSFLPTGSEFFSTSTDGQVLWWDIRKLGEPTESLLLDPEKNGTVVGGTVLDFETTMLTGKIRPPARALQPTKFMVGSEAGSIFMCNKKAKTANDRISHTYLGHHGPIYALQEVKLKSTGRFADMDRGHPHADIQHALPHVVPDGRELVADAAVGVLHGEDGRDDGRLGHTVQADGPDAERAGVRLGHPRAQGAGARPHGRVRRPRRQHHRAHPERESGEGRRRGQAGGRREFFYSLASRTCRDADVFGKPLASGPRHSPLPPPNKKKKKQKQKKWTKMQMLEREAKREKMLESAAREKRLKAAQQTQAGGAASGADKKRPGSPVKDARPKSEASQLPQVSAADEAIQTAEADFFTFTTDEPPSAAR